MKIHEFEHGLQNRVAIVTGAALGNGRAFCERLAEEGAIIVIADIEDASETVRLVEAVGGKALYIKADCTNPEETQHLIEQTLQHFGTIDILVHNVGMYEEEPFELIRYDQWKK